MKIESKLFYLCHDDVDNDTPVLSLMLNLSLTSIMLNLYLLCVYTNPYTVFGGLVIRCVGFPCIDRQKIIKEQTHTHLNKQHQFATFEGGEEQQNFVICR